MWTQQKEEEKNCCHFYIEATAKLEEGQQCITAHEGVVVNCLSRYFKFFFCLVTINNYQVELFWHGGMGVLQNYDYIKKRRKITVLLLTSLTVTLLTQ